MVVFKATVIVPKLADELSPKLRNPDETVAVGEAPSTFTDNASATTMARRIMRHLRRNNVSEPAQSDFPADGHRGVRGNSYIPFAAQVQGQTPRSEATMRWRMWPQKPAKFSPAFPPEISAGLRELPLAKQDVRVFREHGVREIIPRHNQLHRRDTDTNFADSTVQSKSSGELTL